MKSRFFLVLFFVCLILALQSCHSQKASVTKVTTDAAVDQIYYKLVDSYSQWSDVYLPVQLSLIEPKNLSISGRVTMIRDKEIYFSLRMLGFEVAQIYIDNQKIYIVEKYHKYYYSDDISNVFKGYDITIADIQDMILGRAFVPGKGTVKRADIDSFSLQAKGDDLVITPRKTRDYASWYFTVSRTLPPVLENLVVNIAKNATVRCDYSSSADTPCGLVANSLDLSTKIADNDIKASIEWEIESAKWNSNRKIDFKLPSGYKYIDIPSLLKNIGSL